MPLVSVLVPVFNCRPFLDLALGSIREQTFKKIEIIVVDDGSSDGSAKIIDAHAGEDRRIRVVRRPNTGIVGALNDGIQAAKGGYVARMDGDDIAEPSRLEEQVKYLNAHPDCVAVGSHVRLIDQDGDVFDLHTPPTSHAEIERNLLHGDGGALIHPSVMMRLEALKAVGGYRPEYCKAEDLDLFLRLSAIGQVANIPRPLLRYRLHAASTNFSKRESQRDLVQRVLGEARIARNLGRGEPEETTAAPADLPVAELHRRWSVSALKFGTRRTAIKHALLAVWKDPCRSSCKHLTYALTARSEKASQPR